MESDIDKFESWNGGMEAGVEDWSESDLPTPAAVSTVDLENACEKWKPSHMPSHALSVQNAPVDAAFQIHNYLNSNGYKHVANALRERWTERGTPETDGVSNYYEKDGIGLAVDFKQHPDNISGSAEISGYGYVPSHGKVSA